MLASRPTLLRRTLAVTRSDGSGSTCPSCVPHANAKLGVIAPVGAIAGWDRVVTLPLLDRDVHDLEGLRQIAGHLLGTDR